EAQETPQLVPAPAVPPPRRWPARAAAVISVVALLTLAVVELTSSGRNKGPGPGPSNRLGSLPVIGTANPADSHQGSLKSKQIRVVLVMTADCWIHATADGRLVFPAHTFHAGERVSFTARHGTQLILGAPGSARLHVNGKRIDTGDPGQVAKLKFALEKGKVV